jgi:putative acetyltransferase
VRRLRSDALVAVALVAEDEEEIVGHIVLSWLPTRIDCRPVRAVALAPMAVRPERQRCGIGTALVEHALQRAALAGADAAIVLGVLPLKAAHMRRRQPSLRVGAMR